MVKFQNSLMVHIGMMGDTAGYLTTLACVYNAPRGQM